jgi:hypothetical protein
VGDTNHIKSRANLQRNVQIMGVVLNDFS